MPRNKLGHFYYAFYPIIMKTDTQHLSLAEDGAYRRLIDEYMTTRQPIPANDRSISRILGCGLDEWLSVKENVISYFKLENPPGNPLGFYRHSFCDRELLEDEDRILTARENGRKGGRGKTAKNKENSPKEPSGLPNPLTPPLSTHLSHLSNTSKTEHLSNGNGYDFKNGFRIQDRLTDKGWREARIMAPGWDMDTLCQQFNEFITEPPNYPDKAFSAWLRKVTKGEAPNHQRTT